MKFILSKSVKLVGILVNKVLPDIITVNLGVLAGIADSVALAGIDCSEGDSKEETNDSENLEGTLGIVCWGPVSVLPNDISRLSSFNKEKVIVHELFLGWLAFAPEVSIWLKFLRYNEAIFFLECNEGINWAYKLIELLILEVRNLSFNFAHLFIALEHNVTTTGTEKLDKLCIVESEDDISDLDFLDLQVLGTTGTTLFQFNQLVGKDSLELLLHVGLKALSNRDIAFSSLITGVDVGKEELVGLL